MVEEERSYLRSKEAAASPTRARLRSHFTTSKCVGEAHHYDNTRTTGMRAAQESYVHDTAGFSASQRSFAYFFTRQSRRAAQYRRKRNAREVSLLDALDQPPSTTGNKSTLNPGSTVQSFAAFQVEVEIASSSEIYSPGASERVEIQRRSYKMRQGANER